MFSRTDFFAFPTSFHQQRLWFLDQLQPQSATYNVSKIVVLPGRPEAEAVKAALHALFARHDTLRTTLPAVDGQPYQLVSSQPQLPLRHLDMRDWSRARQAEETRRLFDEEVSAPFDLAAGPLVRVSLLQGRQESLVLFAMHHAVTDGTSMELLAAELRELVEAAAEGRPQTLPELPLQYGDYAVWQREWLSGPEAREQLAYWKGQLAGAPPVLELPWDRPRPAERSADGAALTMVLPRRLSRRVLAFSRAERVTPFMTLLAAFQILMARLSGTCDIVVGTPIAGRARTELEGLVGFFVNTLALRTRIDGNPTLREIVRRAETTAMEAYAHQELPFDRLVAEIAPDRTLSHGPLVQVLFALQNVGGASLARPAAAGDDESDEDNGEARSGDEADDVPQVPGAGVKFDLTWALAESDDGIGGHVEYSTALLDAATVRRWIGMYQRILAALVDSPETRVESLALLGAAERERAIEGWNDTAFDYPREASLCALFAQQVAARPRAVAVSYGERSLDYAGLDAHAAALARALIGAGVVPGDRVAVCLPRSVDLIVTLLAVVRCGAAYVPLDPHHPAERVAAIARDAEARLVVDGERFAALANAADQPDRALPAVDAGAPAYVMYTSGSTGQPKGCVIPHRAIVRLVRDTNYTAIAADDCIAQASNVAFDAATFEIWGALLNGARLVGLDRDTALSPARYAQALRREGITILFVTTALFNQVAREAPDTFAGLRQVMFGGEAADPRAVRAVLDAGRPARLQNMYGPTETTTFATFHEIEHIADEEVPLPIGRPIGNTQAYVLDERLEPQPVGVDGELYLGGDGLALEYFRAPELTAARFVPDPFHPGWRLYRTGDIVRYREDGAIDFVGRRDHQVKVRGFRVELGEIESVLATHEAVREVVVAAHATDGALVQLLAYLAWNDGARPTLAELRAWTAARLPDYMVPAYWIELERLPLNANGKVDRPALPLPGGDRPDLGVAYVEPATPAEQAIAAVWSQLLGIARVGLHDNFFALGGHSLLATQAVARVRDQLGTDLPVRVMFERPTVAALAEWAAARGPEPASALARGAIARRHSQVPAPLSFSQQRLWFLDQLDPRSTLYNIHTSWHLAGALDLRSLEQALAELLRRHEALRTHFTVSDGMAVQIVDPPAPVRQAVTDLSRLPPRAAEEEYARRCEADTQTPFELARGPLFRAQLFTLAGDDHRLAMTMHHVISDGWSLSVLQRELDELYAAFTEGREPVLPALAIQYADFAVWQRQRLQGEELAQLLAWWRGYLKDAPQLINLPTDRPRPAEQNFRGETQTRLLPASLHAPLERLGQREGATLFITLLTAWVVLLHRFSGEDDIVIGTPIANRTRSELEPLIGFFVNTLLIRATVDGNPSFRELLRHMRDAANGAYAHQDLPFERLVAELAPERRLSHTPLFQCFFALQKEATGLRSLQLAADETEIAAATSMFDLSLTMLDAHQQLAASFEYSTALFERAAVTRLMGHLQRLLEGVAADPDRPIFDYTLLDDDERRQVLHDFNATAAPYPEAATVVELFEARAAAQPSAPALDGEQGVLSYAELDARASRMAARLAARGAAPGRLVGLAIERSHEMVVALLAVLKTGAAYVPLDPQYPRTRLARMMTEAALAAIVTSRAVAVTLPPHDAALVCLDTDGDDGADAGAVAARPARPARRDLAYVIYTSGSTGQPKGVPIDHRALLNYTEAACESYGIAAADRVLQFGSLNFDASIEEIFPVLTRGGTLVLRTPEMASSVTEFLQRCAQWRVSLASLPTAFWHELVVALASPSPGQPPLPETLRHVVIGGDRALPERVAAWARATQGRVRLSNSYGPTEATVVVTVQPIVGDGAAPAPEAATDIASEVAIGRPIRNTRIYILDPHRQPVPVGVRGELWIAGDGLSPGYLHRPDLTQERFLPDPFAGGGQRMYRSGDVARWRADGVLEFRGRADRQVKVRGYRIELGEIEGALNQHEAVKESVVLAHEDAGGHKRLVAYVVPQAHHGGEHDASTPQQVGAWEAVFDDLYEEIDPSQEAGFYIKGWDSSYSGEAIPAAEVETWMQQTVERILSFRPQRVREIGCGGSGLMLQRIAPHCRAYTATDLSANAVRVLTHQLARLPQPMPGVQVLQRPAHDQALKPASVDAVLIVSVAQYFPNVEYLLEVLERAVDGIAPGGVIFIGDLRNHALLDAFHASVQLARAEPGLASAELRRRVRKQRWAEKQLTVDPAFFHALARHIPKITAVEVCLLRGRNRNELTRFRYDLVLHVGARADAEPVDWQDWRLLRPTLAEMRARLLAAPGATHGWAGVPNVRVERDVRAAALLAAEDAPETAVALAAAAAAGAVGIDPEDLWSLGDELGLRVDIGWNGFAADGAFDVLFRPAGRSAPPHARAAALALRPWDEYANDPTRRLDVRELVPRLRQHAREHLPAYMVPSQFVVLDALPLTNTGKIDRKALVVPEAAPDEQTPADKPRTAVEETLARIWAEVLDVPAVGITDNFFQLGGDSILSIQVIARANEAGLRLTPKQLFQHQTIAELAALAGSTPQALAAAGEARGDVPLTPIQRWFFEADLRQVDDFTQSASFELDPGCDLATAQRLLDSLQGAHDALRLRFAREDGRWRQFHIDDGARIPVVEVELPADPEAAQQAIDGTALDLQRGLDIGAGPIARAALFSAAPGAPRTLLVVAHHLVVDGVSWRILQDDMRTLLAQWRAARPLEPAARSTSFQYWARRLTEYAASREAEQAAAYWTGRLASAPRPLPLDQAEPAGSEGAGAARVVRLSFSARETQALLQEVPKAYRTQINDVLLAALAQALAAWTGQDRVLLDLEGHGREPIFDEVDLSRTVGWFTSVYPVLIELPAAPRPGEVLRSVKEQLRGVPGRGLSFGVLRYLSDKPELRERLRALPQPQVCFNYLGQFGALRLPPLFDGGDAGEGTEDAPAVEVSEEAAAGEWGSSSHLLDINGGVNDGRLWVSWAFATRFHRAQTIESVARRFATELRRLIAHCTTVQARGYSPSDFPLAGLDQDKLDWLIGSDRQVADLYPLSPMQAGMLFHALYDPDGAEYLEQSLQEMPPELDVAALRQAWDLLVERHPVLRTSFLWSGLDAPLQMVRTGVELPWQIHDWSALGEEEAAEALERYMDDDRSRGFDLARAPLLRFALFRHPDGGWWFLWTSHHISLDGWSQARLKAELVALYDALVAGQRPQLEPVRPFRHYIEWLQQQDLARAEAYWREALRDFDTPTPLAICDSADSGDDAAKTYLEQQRALDAADSAAIEQLARQAMVTANTVAQGAWALLLSRYSGETDVLFGATVAGRPAALAGVESMIGLFINTLPVRVQVQPDISVGLWLKHLQRQQIDAREFEHAPLVQVQGWSGVRRGAPLFESLLVFENYPEVPSFTAGSDDDADVEPDGEYGADDGAADHDASEPGVPMERTNYPLTIAVIPGERWIVRATYDAERIDDDAVRRLLGHYCRLLGAFALDQTLPLREVPMLGAAERRQMLDDWNHGSAEPHDAAPAHRLFEAQAERTPDAPAVESAAGAVSYAALNARANALARQIRACGVGTPPLVGIALERSVDMLVAVLAALKAGRGYVPLDPAYPAERLAYMLEDSGLRLLLTQRTLAGRFGGFGHTLLPVDEWAPAGRNVGDEAGTNLALPVGADDLACVIYTSGSTGKPKGVAMPHGPLANLLRWHLRSGTPRPGARTLQFAPLSFDVHFQELFSTWAAGGTVLLVGEALRRDMPALLRRLAAQRADRLFLPFVALQALAEAAGSSPGALPPLREVITAGEQLRATPAIRALFGALPMAELHNHYGPTETHVVTALRLEGAPADWPALPPIGRPIDCARAYIVDAHLQPQPVGVAGQLCIGGPVLARGYLNRDELSAARFVRDPFVDDPAARIYLTGDRARYRADGQIEFLGRTDLQLKVRGFRIEPGEVEAALEQHAELRQCVVCAVEDVPGEASLVAYVVPQQLPGPAAPELRRFVEARLPDYMVPAVFVTLEVLPLTPSGKVDRLRLPAPDRRRGADAPGFVAARDPVEERLAAIYADVLHVERIGVEDNFFDLGGHSLLATRIVSRIRDVFQVELPLRAVFESPTVAGIAAVVMAAGSASLREQRIPRRREAGTCRLSYAQQRLWFLEQLHPGTALYHVSRTFAFAGTARATAVGAALNEIVRRHEVLRSTYASIDGRPFQLIAASQPLAVPEHDLRRLRPARREQEFQRLRAEVENTPFDLARGPVLRAALVRLSATQCALVLAMHHIATDGWSMDVLARELELLYRAAESGRPAELPELPVQYADYAVWQRQRLEGDAASLELVRCRKRLEGMPASLELPWDRPRPPQRGFEGGVVSFGIPAPLTQALLSFSRQREVTLYTTLLAAFKLLLARLSGSHDIVVGTAVSGRSHTEVEGLIGLFVNTLVLRTDLQGNPTLEEALRRVQRSTLEAFDSQDLPFDRLVAELAPERHLAHHPLVQVMFAHQDARGSGAAPAAGAAAATHLDGATAKFDLTLTVVESGAEQTDALAGSFEYASALLDDATVLRWAGLYLRLLAALAEAPQTPLAEVALLTPEERRRALVDWNDTAREYPRQASIGALFAAQAAARPQQPALRWGGQSISYRELDTLSARIAAALRQRGVAAGAVVAVEMERSPLWVAALLAIVRCGAAYLPLDPAHPELRRQRIGADAGAVLTVTAAALDEWLAARALDPGDDLPAETDRAPAGDGDSVAYVMYTSGSTGDPKGIVVPHRAVVRLVRNTNYVRIGPRDRIAQASHAAFDAATFEVWGALLNGATLVGVDRDTLLSPQRYAALLRDERVSILFVTTALFNQLAREAPGALAGVRQVMFGGEAADPQAVRAVLADGPPRRLMNVYGPTETTTFATFHEIHAGDALQGPLPIGMPIGNTQVYVLDERLEPQPPGVPGEICIGGDGLALGYLQAPGSSAPRPAEDGRAPGGSGPVAEPHLYESAQCFVANPFGPGRLYRSGDLGRYRADGAIEFIGRADQQLKIRGFRVETGEIESALRAHPQVRDALVLPHAWADGPTQLVAYVVPHDGRHAGPAELRPWLEARLPHYMVPAHWIELAAFPLNRNGKIDRHALPLPDGQRPDLAVAYAEATTPLQAALVAIWCELLRADRVGIHDGFFELGGHSLLATQVVSRLRDAIGVEVPVRLLFERPTIAALAEALGDGSLAEASLAQITRRSASGPAPLSSPQERLWFLDQIDPGTALYNIHDQLSFKGPLRRAALEAALAELVERHQVLRTAFAAVDGVATQIVSPALAMRLRVADLGTLPRAEREAACARLADEESQHPFVLSRPPQFRALLVRLSARRHRLLLTLHHIVADGWSLAVLHRELRALYEAFAQGRPSLLAELPVQYADYAAWQRACLASGALQPQLEYWRRQLAQPPRAVEIPLDRPRPAQESSAGARQTLALSPALSADIRGLSQQAQATPFMVLLAAFDLVLHRYTGETDLVVGCPVAGRTRAEIENLIGFFLNTLALRVDCAGDPSFEDLLGRVRQTALDAFAHQDLPYERILEELAPDRSARAQLFRVYFNVVSFDTGGVELLEAAPPARDEASDEAADGLPSAPTPARSIFDLTLYVLEQGGCFVLDAVYRNELFDASTITRLLGHLQQCLRAAVRQPRQRLSRFELTAAAAAPEPPVALQAVRFRPFVAEDIEQSIGQRFEQQAVRHATRVAVRTRRHQWTYAELRRRAHQVAAALRQRGLAPGERVALLCAHDAPMIAALLGVLMAGGVYVPLDPAVPAERHRQMLADAEAACIVADDSSAALAAPLANGRALALLTLAADGAADVADAPRPALALDPQAPAYILYTSGSTGQPKGVLQNHRNVLHHCRTYTQALHLNGRDRLALLAAYGFDAAVMDIFGALLNGATLVPADVRAESPESLFDWIDECRVTVLHGTPTLLRHLLRHEPQRRLAAVRALVLGGEEVVRSDVELYHRHFGRGCVLVNGLGPTESTLALQFLMDHDTAVPRHGVPVGWPVAGTEVLLLDETGQPVSGCGSGELALRGRHLACGYWRRPELTAQAFSADAADPTQVTYRSGDRARRLPDGRFEFLGRTDLQFKLRGVRIEPGEIEAALRAHAAVGDAVITLSDAAPDERRLVAYVTTPAGTRPAAAELAAFLRQRLPESLVPAVFVALDALPLTANGKVDRRALPAPSQGQRLDLPQAFVAPSTATERTLAAIWASLLRLPEIGANANFFELGGHSLLATQLASRVRSLLNVDLPLRQYFSTPTLGALAALIDQAAPAREADRQAIPRARRELYRVRVNGAGEFVLPASPTALLNERDAGGGVADATPDARGRATVAEAAAVDRD